jgi:hypothetical protein
VFELTRESRRSSQDSTGLTSAAVSNNGQDGEQFGLFRLDENDTASDSRPVDNATSRFNADIIAIHRI